MSRYEYDWQDYFKLLNYCAEIVKSNIERFKDVDLNEIKASIEADLEVYEYDGSDYERGKNER